MQINRQPFRKSERRRWHPFGQSIGLFFRAEAIEISKFFSATYFDGNRRHFFWAKEMAGGQLFDSVSPRPAADGEIGYPWADEDSSGQSASIGG